MCVIILHQGEVVERAAAWLIRGTPPLHPTAPGALPVPSEVFLADGASDPSVRLPDDTRAQEQQRGARREPGVEWEGGGWEECMTLGTLHA